MRASTVCNSDRFPNIDLRKLESSPGVALQYVRHDGPCHSCCRADWPVNLLLYGVTPVTETCESHLSDTSRLGADDAMELRGLERLNLALCRDHELWLFRAVTSGQPTYYRRRGALLCWSTNPIELLGVDRLGEVDADLLPALIAGEKVDPARSAFRTLTRLPSGYLLRVSNAEVKLTQLVDFEPREPTFSLPDAVSLTRELTVAAVRSVVPSASSVAVLLSGGLDSPSWRRS